MQEKNLAIIVSDLAVISVQQEKSVGVIWSTICNETAIFLVCLKASPHGQNGHHFAENIFSCIFMYENFCILIKISLKFAPKGLIDNYPALV